VSELKKIRVSFSEDDGGFARKATHSFLSQLDSHGLRRDSHRSAEELGVATVSEAIGAVRQWQSDVAIVPYFNSVSGLDDATAQELVKGGLQILGELRTRTEHALVTSRSAFRNVIANKGTPEDLEKFERNELSREDGERLSILFVNWMIDIFGHPKSFEQCNSFLSSQGLPSRDHQRMQNDPVKMVLRVSELVDNAKTGNSGGGMGFSGGSFPILAPVSAGNKAVTTEDLYTVATRGLLPIPSPFVAALAPKDFFTKITNLKGRDTTHHDAPEFLKREIIELVHPRLNAFDPPNNVTRYMILARSDAEKDTLVYPVKHALLVCSGSDICKVVESKIAFAAELKKKPSWSAFKDRLGSAITRLSVGGTPKLMPPEFLEHPREQAVVFEAKVPASAALSDPDARPKSVQSTLKRLDGTGHDVAKSLNDPVRGIKSVIYLGTYASLADTDIKLSDDEGAGPCIMCNRVRRFAGQLIGAAFFIALLAGLLYALTQGVECKPGDQRSAIACQYRQATDPIYNAVASRVETWWAYLEQQFGDAKSTQQTRTADPAVAEQCVVAQPVARSTKTQSVETTLNCPSECSNKCVIEKHPGKAPFTRCVRPPSCPAAAG
jgi:prephenate dehydratase